MFAVVRRSLRGRNQASAARTCAPRARASQKKQDTPPAEYFRSARNVLDELPKEQHAQVRLLMRAAYKLANTEEGLADFLEELVETHVVEPLNEQEEGSKNRSA